VITLAAHIRQVRQSRPSGNPYLGLDLSRLGYCQCDRCKKANRSDENEPVPNGRLIGQGAQAKDGGPNRIDKATGN